jgi:hypothetical protein
VLIYTEYKCGLNTEPWSTPVLGENGSEATLFRRTDTITSSKRLAKRETRALGADEASIDCQMIRRSTVSYAALMSRNATTG